MSKELRALLAKKFKIKEEARALLDDNKLEEARAKTEELRSLDEEIEILRALEDDEDDKFRPSRRNISDEQLEERAIKNYIAGKSLTEEERQVVNSEDNSALLPEGFIKYLEDIKQGYKPLKDLVHVIPVTTLDGKMPVNYGIGKRGLADLGSDDEIEEDKLKTDEINYSVKDLGKIIRVRNSTLEDSGISIKEMIASEFIEDSVYTEDEHIIKAFREVAKKESIKNDVDLVKKINLMSPVAKSRGAIVVNPLGFDYLDNLRDKEGRPLLRELSQGGEYVFKGMRVRETSDDLVTSDKPVLLIGDFYKAVKFFDRRGIEIAASSEAGFSQNRTYFRVLKRHDVQKGKLGEKPEKFALEVTIGDVVSGETK